MNISLHRTAKSLELVEVEVYGCFIAIATRFWGTHSQSLIALMGQVLILYSYLFLRKIFIIQTKCNLLLFVGSYIGFNFFELALTIIL